MSVDISPDDESPLARICRVVNVVEALPDEYKRQHLTSETPLRDVLPGGWPTYGDLVAVAEKYFPKR